MTKENKAPTSAELLLDEAEEMTWALLDDQLDEAGAVRLSELLDKHKAARDRYLECVQLHVELADHFGNGGSNNKENESAPGAAVAARVLPNLFPDSPVNQSMPPVID